MSELARAARSVAHGLMIGAAILLLSPAMAADHGDGYVVAEHPRFDITDYFIFPHLADDGGKRLAFILSVHPNAGRDTTFDPQISYRVKTRTVSGFRPEPFTAIVEDDELMIDCRVSGARPQTLSCTLYRLMGGEYKELAKTSVAVGDRSGGRSPAFKIFGGHAADQLFSDRARVRMPVWRDRGFNQMNPDGTPVWPGVNSQAGKDVLSLVIDLDVATFYPRGGPLLASVSETHDLTAHAHEPGGEVKTQVDRMGRVETTVFILRDTNNPLRDLWNAEDTFDIDPSHIPLYEEGLQEGLERLDLFELSLTGQNVRDWPVPHPWIHLIMNEFLIVDLRHPVDPSTHDRHYLDIEIGHFTGRSRVADAVGGRVCNEDVIERTLTVFINGLDRPEPNRGVGVPVPARACVDEFPFVAPPFGTRLEASAYRDE